MAAIVEFDSRKDKPLQKMSVTVWSGRMNRTFTIRKRYAREKTPKYHIISRELPDACM